jgi:hypothetical protein
MEDKLFDFFKTFVDINRLRMAALLSQKPCTIEDLAEQLKLRVSDVPRHLNKLEKAGLVKYEGNRYQLDVKALETLSCEVMGQRQPVAKARSNDQAGDDFDRQVLKNYSLPDGRLKEIPSQEKKLLPILRHVIQALKPGVRYTEKEVNQSLARYHADYASLRRYLVDRRMLLREVDGTAYWRK